MKHQGTHRYLAPETYDGYFSESSDIFAVGVITYVLLTGRFPFGDDVFEDGSTATGSPGTWPWQLLRIKESMVTASSDINWSYTCFSFNPEIQDFVKSMLSMNR